MSKVLYVVVKHRKDTPQKWKNAWLDDDRLKSIITTKGVVKQCEMQEGKPYICPSLCRKDWTWKKNCADNLVFGTLREDSRFAQTSSNSLQGS